MWKLTIYSPIDNSVLGEETHKSVKDISQKYTKINYETWRNISTGRSKVYKSFYDLKKI